MIQSHIAHIVFHISPENVSFYKDLMGFLGWQIKREDVNKIGFIDSKSAGVWYFTKLKDNKNDYDSPGFNHIAFTADTIADVNKSVEWLKERGIPTLFNTPCHRPEFRPPGMTYYQVMFETPDHILFEIVYSGPLE